MAAVRQQPWNEGLTAAPPPPGAWCHGETQWRASTIRKQGAYSACTCPRSPSEGGNGVHA
eukprot:15467362-Alexandrium_andersonii.AAC.1